MVVFAVCTAHSVHDLLLYTIMNIFIVLSGRNKANLYSGIFFSFSPLN